MRKKQKKKVLSMQITRKRQHLFTKILGILGVKLKKVMKMVSKTVQSSAITRLMNV